MVTGCTMLQQQQELQRLAPELRSSVGNPEICNMKWLQEGFMMGNDGYVIEAGEMKFGYTDLDWA